MNGPLMSVVCTAKLNDRVDKVVSFIADSHPRPNSEGSTVGYVLVFQVRARFWTFVRTVSTVPRFITDLRQAEAKTRKFDFWITTDRTEINFGATSTPDRKCTYHRKARHHGECNQYMIPQRESGGHPCPAIMKIIAVVVITVKSITAWNRTTQTPVVQTYVDKKTTLDTKSCSSQSLQNTWPAQRRILHTVVPKSSTRSTTITKALGIHTKTTWKAIASNCVNDFER